MGKKPIVSVSYENERISMKNSSPYIKCVLRLSCVVHGPFYGRFMGCTVNSPLSHKGQYQGWGLQRSGPTDPIPPKFLLGNTRYFCFPFVIFLQDAFVPKAN